MDIRTRYGLGVAILGLGNLLVGVAQLLTGGELTLSIGLQFALGAILGVMGVAIVNNADSVDPEDTSPRMLTAVGWAGIVFGAGMIGWSAIVIVNAVL